MRLFVILASVAAALAQLTVNTPQGVLACTNYQISWTGGTGPYILQIQPGGDTSAAALETFTNVAASPYQWLVIEPANTQVFVRLHDASGAVAESGTFTIQSSGITTCSASSATGTDSTTAAAPTSDSSSTPAPAGSSTPAPSGNSNSSSSSRSTTSTPSTGGAAPVQVAGGLVALVGAVAVALA